MSEEIEPLVVPLPRVAVEGTVVASEDGRPLAGAEVRYWFDPADEYERPPSPRRDADRVREVWLEPPPVRTDAAGRYRIEGIPYWPGGPRKVGATAEGRFPASRCVDFAREGEVLRVDLRLHRARVLRGTARTAEGAPVEGARVGIWLHSEFPPARRKRKWKPFEDSFWPCHQFHRPPQEMCTDRDGRYVLSPIPREMAASLSANWEWGRARPAPEMKVHEVEWEVTWDPVFDPAGQVEIVLATGRGPLPRDVSLSVGQRGEREESRNPGMTLRDIEKWHEHYRRTVISSLPPGPSAVIARALTSRGPGGETRVPVIVRARERVRVRIPMPPARSRRPWKPGSRERPFFIPWGTPPPGRPTAAIAGVVRDAETGRPVPGALVSDIWRPAGERLRAPTEPVDLLLEARPSRTDRRGRFRIGGIPLQAGEPRKVLVEAVGYWTTSRVYEFRGARRVPRFDIRLRPAGTVRGTVRDAEGRPRAGVRLHAWYQRDLERDWREPYRVPCTHLMDSGTVYSTTGADGTFALSPLLLGRWIKVGCDPDHGRGVPNGLVGLSSDHPEARLDFVVDPGGTLVVEVQQPEDAGVGEIDLELRRSGGGIAFSCGWALGEDSTCDRSYMFQEHSGVPPGEYRLHVSAKGMRAQVRPARVRIKRGESTSVHVRLSPERPSGTTRRRKKP